VNRVIVIGNSGSGKSTLGREVASRLGVQFIEADSIFHQPNWTELPAEEFRATMDNLTNTDSWVLDGNYQRFLLDITWPKADTVIWLDYHQSIVLWRVIRRTLGRLVNKKTTLWNGNRETWRMTFSKQSIIIWSLNMHYTYRRRYEKLLRLPETGHLQVVHLKSPREARAWIAALTS
jgi:adenylate kinase family enzyme